MSKKMKKAFAASIGLMTPATFAHANIPARVDKVRFIDENTSNETIKEERASSSDRINSLCEKNPELLSLLTREIYNKDGIKIGIITLEPLCEKHKAAYSTIFDIKDAADENANQNEYYKYFTKATEIHPDKGPKYFEKHIGRIANEEIHLQNIFFTISYSPIDEASGEVGESSYVGCIGLSRAHGGKPDLEIVVSPRFAGRRIASNALGCMIDFLNSYNFMCDNDYVDEIEAIIATENKGSIGMARNNHFIWMESIADTTESNGHKSDRWNLKLHRNPVLKWARKTNGQSLIVPLDNEYPERKMVLFEEFFEHPIRFKACGDHYEKIKRKILEDMRTIVNNRDVETLKRGLYTWPVCWISQNESNPKESTLNVAIDLKRLPDEISSIRKSNANCKHKKAYIECPDVTFKKNRKR